MGVFVKGQKLNAKKMQRAKIMLPEQGEGCYVWVRALSALEVQRYLMPKKDETEAAEPIVQGNLLIALCAQDDEGEPIFTDADDVAENFDVGADKLFLVIDKINELSGIPKDRSAK